jgi:hypothetical protein
MNRKTPIGLIGFAAAIIGITAFASIAAASLTFSGSGVTANSAVVIDGSSTISIGTSTATGITIGNPSSTVSFPGNVAVGSTIFGSNGPGSPGPSFSIGPSAYLGQNYNNLGPDAQGYLQSYYTAHTDVAMANTHNIAESTPSDYSVDDLARAVSEFNGYSVGTVENTGLIDIYNPSTNTTTFAPVLDVENVIGGTGNISSSGGPGSDTGGVDAIYAQVGTNGAGVLQNVFTLDVDSAYSDGAGSITNAVGLFVNNQTAGQNNYAIETRKGKVSFGDVVQIATSTYSFLPICNPAEEGTQHPVTDAPTSTIGATISAGSGSNHILAYCDGTNWTVMAK